MSKLNAITAPFKPTIHGIDPYAPGGLDKLFAHHFKTFGNAVMEAGAGGDGGSGDGGSGDGAGAGTGAGDGAGTGAGDGQGGDEQLGEGGKKALKAERDARTKAESDLSTAQKRIKELEDATKSDDDKRNERFTELEKSDREKDSTISSQASIILRYQVAAAKGLDLEAAERLRGTTKEEIEADADDFKKKFGSNRPGEVPGAGHRGSDVSNATPGLGRMASAYAATSK
ncbi:hypothetical protein QEH68_06695 [Paenarthrobacter sp. OM7]|uniref:hypothetical protein n=1 Tax=Paenarthrobacter sp. OM7 TaxID=3041264 RepID=UPI00246966D9|nr:hypothetical protein [Paenarthrobacter sp. OM7]WGM21856.1 hypothetical protein QEH68_06695 [Paenarthrobacter sp. OM7]